MATMTLGILPQVIIRKTGQLAQVLSATLREGKLDLVECAIDRITSTWYSAREFETIGGK